MKTVVFVDSNAGGLAALETARRMGCRVVFVRSRRFADMYRAEIAQARISHAHEVIEIDDALDPRQLDEALIAVRDRIGIDALITVFAFAVLAVAESAARLGLPFTDVAAVRAACEKDRCRELVERAGVPPVSCTPVSTPAEAREVAARIGYPVLIKPAVGGASLGASRIDSEVELLAFFDGLAAAWAQMPMELGRGVSSGRLLVEAFIEGPLISVEIGTTRQGTVIPFMVGKRTLDRFNPVLELGTTMPAPIPARIWDEAVEQAQMVVRALGLDLGIYHIEFIASASGPRLVEVNPRLMGGNLPALFTHVTGCDMFELLIRIHLGEEIDSGPYAAKTAICSRLIAADQHGAITALPTREQREQLEARTVLFNLNVNLGQPVEEYSHSFNGIGHFVIAGSTPDEASRNAESMVQELAGLLEMGLK